MFKSLFLTYRFFIALGAIGVLYLAGYFFNAFNALANILMLAFGVLILVDFMLLYFGKGGIVASRSLAHRLSNGDYNEITLHLENKYPFEVQLSIIDEIPHHFNIHNFLISTELPQNSNKTLKYKLKPTERGEYNFGKLNVYAVSPIKILKKRYVFDEDKTVAVYPSYIQMRKFELYAVTNRLSDIGIKKVRRIGQTMEFDQIKEYVIGDDIRNINWSATARTNQLMINHYQDEKSQQVINVIDLGRVMKMPVDGFQLLEYSINSSLVISNIALIKDDKAGLITFSSDKTIVVPAQSRRVHIKNIQNGLYNIDTNYKESNFEELVLNIRKYVKQRSLILLYTNFETLAAMQRQLPYLKQIARKHLLVTIFFEDTEMNKLLAEESKTLNQIYTKVVAEQFDYEKRQIVKALKQHGIHAILTPPKNLSVQVINKYLALKARNLL